MKPETELRELDAWIAEHVVGMKPISENGARPTDGTEDDYFVREWIHVSESLPHYTTNPADAMAVLERCREKSQSAIAIGGKGRNDYIVGEAYVGPNGISARADTLPLAIAKFARQLFSA